MSELASLDEGNLEFLGEADGYFVEGGGGGDAAGSRMAWSIVPNRLFDSFVSRVFLM